MLLTSSGSISTPASLVGATGLGVSSVGCTTPLPSEPPARDRAPAAVLAEAGSVPKGSATPKSASTAPGDGCSASATAVVPMRPVAVGEVLLGTTLLLVFL